MFRIAWKDLSLTFRNPFSLVMMFAAPLLITTLLFFAFGNLGRDSGELPVPTTRVAVANLDDPSGVTGGLQAGRVLVENLQGEAPSGMLELRQVNTRAAAVDALRTRDVDVAVIIPEGFTLAVLQPGRRAVVEVLHDPAATLGPNIVLGILRHFLDGFSGSKITAEVVSAQFRARGLPASLAILREAALLYSDRLQAQSHGDNAAPVVRTRPPGVAERSQGLDFGLGGPIMAGMMIFFLFFIGANGALTILHEQESGTLPRLRVTPVSLTTPLSGKLLVVLAALSVQAIVLLVASALLFHISWVSPGSVFVIMVGTILAAGGFGIMLMSLLRSSRQTGPVMGGVITVIGMLGGLMTTGLPQSPQALERFSLLVPTGWALRGLKLSLTGARIGEVLLPALVLVLLGIGFMAVGILGFRRRFSR